MDALCDKFAFKGFIGDQVSQQFVLMLTYQELKNQALNHHLSLLALSLDKLRSLAGLFKLSPTLPFKTDAA